jgi:hypothetical protein
MLPGLFNTYFIRIQVFAGSGDKIFDLKEVYGDAPNFTKWTEFRASLS